MKLTDSIILFAKAKPGSRFDKWSDGVTTNPREFLVKKAVGMGASFVLDDTPVPPTPTTYTITVNSNDTSMGTVTGGGVYESGTTATLTATAESGYKFVSWNDGNTNTTRTITVSGNATYTATFAVDTPVVETVTIQLGIEGSGSILVDGESHESGTVNVIKGGEVTISNEPGEGYEFAKYIVNGDDTEGEDGIYKFTAEEPVEIIAVFINTDAEKYTVTVRSEDDDKGTVTGGGIYDKGTNVPIKATANDGYAFDHWEDGEGGQYSDNPLTIESLNGNIEFVAYFKEDGESGEDTHELVITPTNKAGADISGELAEAGIEITSENELINLKDGDTVNINVSGLEDSNWAFNGLFTVSDEDEKPMDKIMEPGETGSFIYDHSTMGDKIYAVFSYSEPEEPEGEKQEVNVNENPDGENVTVEETEE